MNKLNVVTLSINSNKYVLVNESGECISSLEIDYEVTSNYRRERCGFPFNIKIYYLCNFCTKRNLRGRGYGRELLNLVKEETKGQFIYLKVGAYDGNTMTDEDLVNFYQSLGFEDSRIFDDGYKMMVLDNR